MNEDKTLVCVDCKNEFPFTDGEQKFFEDKGLTPPKRCVDCRAIKKRNREQQENSKY